MTNFHPIDSVEAAVRAARAGEAVAAAATNLVQARAATAFAPIPSAGIKNRTSPVSAVLTVFAQNAARE